MDALTIPEYNLLMKACELKEVDMEYHIAMLAFQNLAVQATTGKKSPKPKYKKFDDFFDLKKEEKRVMNKKNNVNSRFSRLDQAIKERRDKNV